MLTLKSASYNYQSRRKRSPLFVFLSGVADWFYGEG